MPTGLAPTTGQQRIHDDEAVGIGSVELAPDELVPDGERHGRPRVLAGDDVEVGAVRRSACRGVVTGTVTDRRLRLRRSPG